MINTMQRFRLLVLLGAWIKSRPSILEDAMVNAKMDNPWFTLENQKQALDNIADEFLTEVKLKEWIDSYRLDNFKGSKTIAIIMAGNIPLVGFHDFLCAFISGHNVQLKCSDKDRVLIKSLVDYLISLDNRVSNHIKFVDRIKDFEAVIATGSNNSARYFESYFKNYPHIIRKNRNGIGVFTSDESRSDLEEFGKDVFDYFGMGCRNVSKIYVPKDYDFKPMMEVLHSWNDLVNHNKYKNNFDYGMAVHLLNKSHFYNNGSIILVEDQSIASRIATLHFEYYDSLEVLNEDLLSKKEQIQCIVSKGPLKSFTHFTFGEAQKPSLNDYADGVDTIQFLMEIEK